MGGIVTTLKKLIRAVLEYIGNFIANYNEWEYQEYYQHERDRKKK